MAFLNTLKHTTFTLALSLVLFACGSGGDAEPTNNTIRTTATTQPAPVPVQEQKIQLLFEQDIAKDIRQSKPNDINLPLGLEAAFDIEYTGAFRVEAGGESNSDYAVGRLGFNPDSQSLYLAGHAHHNAIAEFEIPTTLSFAENANDIELAPVLQNYVKVLNKKEKGNQTDKISGLLYYKDNLLVSSEIWYDGKANNKDNLQVFSNAHDIRSSDYKGMLQLKGEAKAAGYMFKVPSEWQDKIGAEYLTGWATNNAIVSRYSHGPSLYRFDPQQAIDAVVTVDRAIDTNALMVFPFEKDKQLVAGSDEYSKNISPIWGPVTNAQYGFIVPGTSYFLAVGKHSGIHSGIGYKITQDNGRLCGGPCAYEVSDNYNYFWIFDINDMLNADDPWNVSPVSYGKWSHPYDRAGVRGILGGAFDENTNTLYLSLEKAGQTGTYDTAPLILSYQITAKS
ncbi:hypothetical protein [Paraglaciecola aestuariivivens]